MSTPSQVVAPVPSGAAPEPIVRLRHPLRVVFSILVGLGALAIVISLITNERYQWGTVAHYFLSGQIVGGLITTLWLTVIAMVVGIVIGVIVAIMKLSSTATLQGLATVYIWFFRGTPVFVQLLFWGYISALYPEISLGIPFGEQFFAVETNVVITPLLAAILGLGLNEGAYMAEIVRTGISSVHRGQIEAAQALGMKRGRILTRIVLPQAMRVIIPPTANETINMLKTTSLVSVLAFPELLYSAQLIYAQNFQTIPLLITASIWYLLVTSVLTVGQFYLERYYGRGTNTPAASGRPRRPLLGRRATRTEGQDYE